MAKKAKITFKDAVLSHTELLSNPNNPRYIKDEKFEKLKTSIKEFEEMLNIRPVVVDENNTVLGGNMRLKAIKDLKIKEIPVKIVSGLTEKQKQEFIIKDNVGFGEWDWDMLANEWEAEELSEWGMNIPSEWGVNQNDFGDDFSLPDGDKEPFQQQTYTLADEQAIQIKNAIDEVKKTEEFKYIETFGNENSNGNALYLLIMQWGELKK
jgi:hypothetical protein